MSWRQKRTRHINTQSFVDDLLDSDSRQDQTPSTSCRTGLVPPSSGDSRRRPRWRFADRKSVDASDRQHISFSHPQLVHLRCPRSTATPPNHLRPSLRQGRSLVGRPGSPVVTMAARPRPTVWFRLGSRQKERLLLARWLPATAAARVNGTVIECRWRHQLLVRLEMEHSMSAWEETRL